ncbi:HAD hydrolase-like protein [Streptacidiphilus sp. NEAU-YB345]|uniref:HAD hydrolase-like protein n=2 Tax=Streptacidiphilus fuscans TaxID=2789292 RepID=A0A931B2F9_9ACTN|nr:HAD hydrolase-like protein [Streptacidiphilus fuscans]
MIAAALRRGGAESEEAVIFGDTVADVEAGAANGVFVVGVATGRTSREELAEAGAGVVLDDLTDTDLVVRLAERLTPDA